MSEQVKNSFDKETLHKIKKSLILTIIAGVGSGALAYSQTRNIGVAAAAAVGAMGAFIVNTIDEYHDGENVDKR